MSLKIIYPEMMWTVFTCLISFCLFLVQVQSLNLSVAGIVVDIRRDIQNISSVEKADLTEHDTKLSDNGNTHFSSENKNNTLTTSSTELYEDMHFISFSRNFSTGALLRGFCVFVALGAIVIIYIVVRTIRLRRKKTTVRKYGILANKEDVEMTPLGAEEEEEESTLFDMTAHNSHT